MGQNAINFRLNPFYVLLYTTRLTDRLICPGIVHIVTSGRIYYTPEEKTENLKILRS